MTGELAGQRIVHLLTTVGHGGAERVVLELAARQREMGADVTVTCLQQLGALLPEFQAAGIPVGLVPGSGTPGALRMAWRTAAELRIAGATVVHTHNAAPQIVAGLGQRLRHWRRAGAILVHTEHGRLGDTSPALLRWRRRTIVPFDAVFAVSSDARAQLLEHGIRSAHGVEVVLNGVDTSRFTPLTDRGDIAMAIVHVGRLDRIKGQDILLDAMPRVLDAVPAATLTIVGDGPTRPLLEAQTARLGLTPRVTFVGALRDVRAQLQRADLFVLPSRSEGISLALLEAMASGLAAVATDVGGNREVLGAGTVGTLVPSEEPRQLADAIITALSAPDALRQAGAAARRLVESRFSSAETARAYAVRYRAAQAAMVDHATRSAA